MEKIRTGTGKKYELIVCGILADSEKLTLKLLPGEESLDSINAQLLNTDATAKLTLLSDSEEELAIYNGYMNLQSITQEMDAVVGYSQDTEQTPITGKLVTVVLHKPDQTEQRIASLEETVDTLVMESLGL